MHSNLQAFQVSAKYEHSQTSQHDIWTTQSTCCKLIPAQQTAIVPALYSAVVYWHWSCATQLIRQVIVHQARSQSVALYPVTTVILQSVAPLSEPLLFDAVGATKWLSGPPTVNVPFADSTCVQPPPQSITQVTTSTRGMAWTVTTTTR